MDWNDGIEALKKLMKFTEGDAGFEMTEVGKLPAVPGSSNRMKIFITFLRSFHKTVFSIFLFTISISRFRSCKINRIAQVDCGIYGKDAIFSDPHLPDRYSTA